VIRRVALGAISALGIAATIVGCYFVVFSLGWLPRSVSPNGSHPSSFDSSILPFAVVLIGFGFLLAMVGLMALFPDREQAADDRADSG